MSILNGPVIEAVNSQNPKKIVIFCHGYGADGNDLISLANYFQPTLPDAVFLSPNAVSYTHLTLPTNREV